MIQNMKNPSSCAIAKFFFALIALLSILGVAPKTIAADRPNFILVFTDDQGYADLSCFGGQHVFTPNIDQMAKEGARLTSFYVAAPLCTPSRAALMTGCYPARIDMDVPSSLEIKMKHIPPGRKFPVCLAGDGKGLNPKELTIAEVARSAGYKTGMFGKWHLGDQPEFLPTRQGFEEYFGIPYSHDIHPKQKFFNFPPLPLLEGEKVIEINPDANYLTRRVTERAVNFIKRNKDEKFFLYVAHPLPHGPLAASPEIKQKYAQQLKSNGKDMMPTLVDGVESPHEYFFYAHWGVLEAVRWKSWKLRIIEGKETLYHLGNDIREKKNVATQHPEIVGQLKAAVQGFENEMEASVRPAGTVENPVPLSM